MLYRRLKVEAEFRSQLPRAATAVTMFVAGTMDRKVGTFQTPNRRYWPVHCFCRDDHRGRGYLLATTIAMYPSPAGHAGGAVPVIRLRHLAGSIRRRHKILLKLWLLM